MTKEEINKKVEELFQKRLKIDASKIEPNTELAKLGIDSLDLVELIMDFEDEFNVTFDNDELNSFKTVNDVLSALAKKLQ